MDMNCFCLYAVFGEPILNFSSRQVWCVSSTHLCSDKLLCSHYQNGPFRLWCSFSWMDDRDQKIRGWGWLVPTLQRKWSKCKRSFRKLLLMALSTCKEQLVKNVWSYLAHFPRTIRLSLVNSCKGLVNCSRVVIHQCLVILPSFFRFFLIVISVS